MRPEGFGMGMHEIGPRAGRRRRGLVAATCVLATACGTNGFLAVDASDPDLSAVSVGLAMPALVVAGDSATVTVTDTGTIKVVGVALFSGETEVGRARKVFERPVVKPTAAIALPVVVAKPGQSLRVVPFASRTNAEPALSAADTTGRSVRMSPGIQVPLAPRSAIARLLFYPRGDQLVALNTALHTVDLHDPVSGARERAIPVGASPVGASFLPVTNRGGLGDTLLVATQGATALSIVDLRTNMPTTQRFLGAVTLQTRDSIGGKITDRSLDVADRPVDVAALCVAAFDGGPCAERAALVATTAAVGAKTPIHLVRYVALSGPRAGQETILTDYLQPDAASTKTVYLDASVRRSESGWNGRDSILFRGLVIDPERLEQPGTWAVAATRDYSMTLGLHLAPMARGGLFASSAFGVSSGTANMRDILANAGGSVRQVLGGGGLGSAGRFAVLSDSADATVAIIDREARVRLALPSTFNFAFVEGGLRGEHSTLAVLVRGAASGGREIVLVDLAGDVVREIEAWPITGGTGAMAAWLSMDGRTVSAAFVDGARLRVIPLTSDR